VVNKFFPEWKHFSFPLTVLRNFVLTPNQMHPAMTYGYEQPSLMGHARFFKLQPTERMGRCEKERMKTKLCSDKNN